MGVGGNPERDLKKQTIEADIRCPPTQASETVPSGLLLRGFPPSLLRFSPWINPIAPSPQPVCLHTCASLPTPVELPHWSVISPAPPRPAALPSYPLTYITPLLSCQPTRFPPFLNGSTTLSLSCTSASLLGRSPPLCCPESPSLASPSFPFLPLCWSSPCPTPSNILQPI